MLRGSALRSVNCCCLYEYFKDSNSRVKIGTTNNSRTTNQASVNIRDDISIQAGCDQHFKLAGGGFTTSNNISYSDRRVEPVVFLGLIEGKLGNMFGKLIKCLLLLAIPMLVQCTTNRAYPEPYEVEHSWK